MTAFFMAEELDNEARSRVAAMAENAKVLEKQGRPKTEEKRYNYNILPQRGVSDTYLTARIAVCLYVRILVESSHR